MNADSGNFSLSAFKRNTAGMVDTNTVLNRTLKTAVYVRPCALLGDLFTPPGCKLKGASLIPEYWLYVIINEKLSDNINPLLHQYNDTVSPYRPVPHRNDAQKPRPLPYHAVVLSRLPLEPHTPQDHKTTPATSDYLFISFMYWTIYYT
jgi:hypothetical protein